MKNIEIANGRKRTNLIKKHIKSLGAVEVSVRSESFSMGSSIDISYSVWKRIPDVEAFIQSLKYGHFDIMKMQNENEVLKAAIKKDPEALKAIKDHLQEWLNSKTIDPLSHAKIEAQRLAIGVITFTNYKTRAEFDSFLMECLNTDTLRVQDIERTEEDEEEKAKEYNYYYDGRAISRSNFLDNVPEDWQEDLDWLGNYSCGYYRADEK